MKRPKDDGMNLKEYIASLISRGYLKQAMDKLLEISKPTNYYGDAIMIMNNFTAYRNSLDNDQDARRIPLVRQMINLLENIVDEISTTVLYADYTADLAAIVDIPQTPSAPHSPQGKTQILFLCANPDADAQLNFDKEVNEIETSLQQSKYRDRFSFHNKRAVNGKIIRTSMLDYEPNIVHFSGHGAGEEGIVILNDVGQPMILPTDTLRDLFELFKAHVQCVILNACYSEQQAKAIKAHIPYVIGMNNAIDDRASIAFSTGFYEALGSNKSYSKAFANGKLALKMAGQSGDNIPQLFE